MCLNFILQALFQSAQHLYEKREGSGFVSLTKTDPDPEGPKTCVSGSLTLVFGSDHGLYESMPSDMRGALCGLWVAVVENNHKEQYRYSSVQ
jgi:hypothetical protein